MELVAKVTVICLVVALTALLLERNTPELGLLLTLVTIAVVMGFALTWYREVQAVVEELLGQAGLDGQLFLPILKILAISLVARLGGDVCRDSGQKALGTVVDLAGTFCALLAAEPLLRRALSLLTQLGWIG